MIDLGWSAPTKRLDAGASAIGDIRAIMEVHLAFEEKALLPILRDDPPLGPQRAERLLGEHSHQRETLATLHREACAFPFFPILAAKLAFLTEWLLADMNEEEHALLVPEGRPRRRRHHRSDDRLAAPRGRRGSWLPVSASARSRIRASCTGSCAR